MTITGTGGTGCDDRSKPPEFRSPPASLIKLLAAPSSAIAEDTDVVWCAWGNSPAYREALPLRLESVPGTMSVFEEFSPAEQ